MSDKNSIIKRFVAGAKCPQCGEQDCLQMYQDKNQYYRECVSCGFKEKMIGDLEAGTEKEISIKILDN